MNNERLDIIEKTIKVFPGSFHPLTIELINEVRKLRELVEAVDTDYGGYACCKDVDGKNWFDVRGEVLNQE